MTDPVTCCNHSMSLVERKKQQWAREREELARLGGQYREYSSIDRAYDRSRYGSKPSQKEQQLPPITSGERRGSLPPLHQNQYNSNKFDRSDRGGETSGYGSDSYPTPEYKERSLPSTNNNGQWNGGNQHNQSGYESSSSYRDDRPKWGDKGAGMGKYWQPKEEPCDVTNEPPNWVKRGLHVDGAIVVANSSPSISPEQRYEEHERPCTGSSTSQNKTHIRGQNIPIDSVELAERERRRQMALAHQEAVRQQLEEKERQRQEERMRKLREEHEEELRIAREQEFERQRKIEEEKAFQAKMEREKKKKEAIQAALEIAEKEAKLEKMRLKMQKRCNNSLLEQNISENIVEKEKVSISPTIISNQTSPIPHESTNANDKMNNSKKAKPVIKNDNIKKEINNNLSESTSNPTVSPAKSTTSLPTSVISNQSHDRSLTPITQSPRNQNTTNNLSPRNENQFTYFFQPTLESLQNIQYAVLLPTAQYPIAIPMNMPTPHPDRSNMDSARTENRMLTPTRYRNNVKQCDSSTQTDTILISARSSSETTTADAREKYICDKMSCVELSQSRRSRSSSVVERPKWGVNRPPTRYLKQSEKDPLYQRRKLRQKRESSHKSYDEKISSDDSQAGTPIHHRKNIIPESMRRSRARWRTEERVFNGNMKMYQREIVPLESDKDQLYLKCCCSCRCNQHRCSENVRVDVLKIEDQSPRDNEERYHVSSRRQRVISLPEFDADRGSGVDLLGKLSSLHNGLLLEQEKWQNSPRSPVPSPHRT